MSDKNDQESAQTSSAEQVTVPIASSPETITADQAKRAAGSTDIQTAPPADKEPAPIRLPTPAAASPGIAAEPFPRWLRGFDIFLMFLLLGLAFLLASFAARNTDAWMNLATGRLIAQGDWSIGVDPFSFATEATQAHEQVTWVNHSWLYSLLLYVLYTSLGGAGVVVVKALLVTGLVWCLLRIRADNTSRWVSVFCIGLAALTMSSQLFLRPTVVSLFLLGITLLIVYRAGALGSGDSNPRVLWVVPILFALWANLDGWFILGPITLGLLWAGTGLSKLMGIKNPVPGRALGMTLGAGLLACLVNPHHVGVFQLPPELGFVVGRLVELPDSVAGGGRTLQTLHSFDVQLRETQLREAPTHLMTSSITRDYWSNPALGLNVAGLVFYPLLVLGLLSFVAAAWPNQKSGEGQLHPGRFLLWLVAALLAVVQYRFLPFFAVIAGPITVLNLGDFLARRAAQRRKIQVPDWRPARLLRLLTLLVFLVLFYLAWPGWLHSKPGDFSSTHRVAWAMPVDPSLEQTAAKLAELQKAGKAPRVYNLSPDVAHYCAWFAPGVKCYLDTRWALFPKEIDNYLTARLALRVRMPDADIVVKKLGLGLRGQAWEKTFADHKIDHLVVSNYQRPDRVAQFLATSMWLQPQVWRQQYADGKTLVFSWGPAGTQKGINLRAESARRAFGEVPPEQRPPREGALFPLDEADFFTLYWNGPSHGASPRIA